MAFEAQNSKYDGDKEFKVQKFFNDLGIYLEKAAVKSAKVKKWANVGVLVGSLILNVLQSIGIW
jgi:hypothetical protein